ncbi:hypothetical protein [Comamonas avium]|uniref:Uncharacterized protein n=1 Tax=Comamonas avium TaxID=2762231 RepID=A0ABR8SCN1_9BURK|nr:hypothetical protein [Comamonas avium]MBD7961233.1 hypothetical protein [Comamonas avium]
MDDQTTTTTQAVMVVQPAPPSEQDRQDMDALLGIILAMCIPVYLLKLVLRQLSLDHD